MMGPLSVAAARVFVSHGKEDSWIASQIARGIRECGASTFLDETDIAKGDDFKRMIHAEIAACSELVVLFTPWSANRFWVWVEVGAAWGQGKRIVAVLCGVTVGDLERLGGSRAILEDINILTINEMNGYLSELRQRINGNPHG